MSSDGGFAMACWCVVGGGAALPHMQEREGGVIVNVGSEAGMVGFKGQVAYNVSKAGIIHLTRSLAVDFAEQNIRANAVCPGTTYTPLVEQVIRNADDPEAMRHSLESIRPMNRLGKTTEIARAILALASDDIGYATGAVLSVDGGSVAQ